MTGRDQPDIVGGILLAALGLFVAFYAQRYQMGTLNRMGPGYFPVVLGWLLVGLGAIIAVPAFFREGRRISIDIRPFVCVIGSLLFFAFALRPLGLILTTGVTVLIASVATPHLRWTGRFALGAVVPFLTYAVFVLGLQMVIPVWPRL